MNEKTFYHGVKRYEIKNIEEILYRGGVPKQYISDFKKASNLENIGHPLYVVVEVNNYCNMRCKMCIKSMDANANGHDNIDIALLDKFLADAHEAGVQSFFLGGETECTVNPQILTIMQHIREIGQGVDDVLITNGYALSDEIIDALFELRWEKVFVSLDAATPETYRKIRGKELERVESNIEKILRKKEKLNASFPIIRVSFCIQDDNIHEQVLFFEKWKEKVDIIDYQDCIQLQDMSILHDLPEVKAKCKRPFTSPMIGCDGTIYPCCTEWGKKMPIGNIKHDHIGEVWNGKQMNELREQIISGKLCDICKTCMYHTSNYV